MAINTVSFLDRPQNSLGDQGTGIKEFDDGLREKAAEIERLMDKNDDTSKAELTRIIDDIGETAKADKNVDNEADDRIDIATDKIKDAIEGDKDIATAATPVLLSEIKSVKVLEESKQDKVTSYEVTLHDGSKVIVDEAVNKEAFGIAQDFENQLRVVNAEGKDLVDDGFGLMGDNELERMEGELEEAKTSPKFSQHGDNICAVEFTDKDGNERKYFAYNGHSQKAFDFLENKLMGAANVGSSGGL